MAFSVTQTAPRDEGAWGLPRARRFCYNDKYSIVE